MKKRANALTYVEEAKFSAAFYDLCPFDDTETCAPFGCPWIWLPACKLEGNTIEEMAANFFERYKDWIESIQKENEERDHHER